jgi:hypothetical protein
VANGKGGGSDLYEYVEVGKPSGHLVLLSKGECGTPKTTCGEGAEVQGVVRTSSDGSHVYFVAKGVLTTAQNDVVSAKGPDKHQEAEPGADNLYAIDTNTGEVKFVAKLCSESAKSGAVSVGECPAKSSEVKGGSFETDTPLWGNGTGLSAEGAQCSRETSEPAEQACDAGSRDAQSTPDGDYLVFATHARLSPDEPKWERKEEIERTVEGKKVKELITATFPVRAVYRYDFQGGANGEGQLIWLSHGAPSFEPGVGCTKPDECQNAVITPLNGQALGATAGIDDWGRAVSGCPAEAGREPEQSGAAQAGSCQHEGEHDGENVIFTTPEKLQGSDVNEQNDVYLWHCSSPCADPARQGTVSMISDGRAREGVDLAPSGLAGNPGMSASGSDIFFTSSTALVAQDRDGLADLYDARIDGGFPRPGVPASCQREAGACQPESARQRELEQVFGGVQPASLLLGGGANVSTVTRLTPSVTIHAARLQGNTLAVSFSTSGTGTVTLSGRALRRVSKILAAGPHQLQSSLTIAGKNARRHRDQTVLEVALKVGSNTANAAMAIRL